MSDICSYAYDTESIVRRLLNVLRNNQEDCDDSTCFDETTTNPNSTLFMMLTLLLVFTTIMYNTRPASLRTRQEAKSMDYSRDNVSVFVYCFRKMIDPT